MSLTSGYRHRLGWNLGFSAYWFAVSYKWFILLFILLPEFVKQIVGPDGEKNTAWGLVLGTGAVWALFGPAVFGRMSEMAEGRWRLIRPWIIVGTSVTLVALVLLFSAKSLLVLGLAYLVLQIGDDLGTGPYAGMVATSVPHDRRGYASAVLGGLKLSGQIISAVVALVLKSPALILIGVGVVNAGCAAWTLWTVRGLAAPEKAPEPRKSFATEYVEPFRDSDFLYVWLNRLICSFAFACITSYTKNYLEDMFTEWKLFGLDLGSATTAAIALALTISLAGVLGSLVSARVADRIGRKPLLKYSAVAMFVFLVPIGLAQSFTPVWAMVFLFGIGNGIYAAADWALISDVLPGRGKAATEMGAWQSSETAVQIPAGIVMGFMIDFLNKRAGMPFGTGYKAMVWTAAALFLVSIFVLGRIKRAS